MSHRQSRARAIKAWELHLQRHTWAEIATELGYETRWGCYQSAMAQRKRMDPLEGTPEAAYETRQSLLGRTRDDERSVFGLFRDAVAGGDAHTAAMLSRELTRLHDTEAKLAGAYAPTETRQQVSVAAVDVADRVAELMTAARVMDAAPAARTIEPAVIDAEVVE